MKSIVRTILVLLLLSGCSTVEEPQTQGPDDEVTELVITRLSEFPSHGRTWPLSFAIADKIYIGTGFGFNATYYEDLWEYDTKSDTWTEKSAFPIGPYMPGVSFVYKGKGYVIAGGKLSCPGFGVPCDHIYYTAVHAYDPSSDTWEKVADLPFLQDMKIGAVEVVGDKAFLFWDMKTYEINMLDFQVTEKSNPPTTLAFSAEFRIGNKAYFACPMNSGKGTKLLYSYDLSTDQWETLADFPEIKRYEAKGFSLNGYGYIVGGIETSFYDEESDWNEPLKHFKEVWQFNPNDNSWKLISEYSDGAHIGHIVETVGNNIYMGFGDGNSPINFEKGWWKLEIK